MKTKLLLSLFLLAGTSIIFFSCAKLEDNVKPQTVSLELPSVPYDYSMTQNGGFDMHLNVESNRATLGRVLFYDTRLSVNNSISCGSCHKQALAFSDNVPFSPGFENNPTLRNSLPIQNISNQNFFFSSPPSLFWDGRASFLQTMVLMPIVNHVEMGMRDMDGIVDRVKSMPYYTDLFIKAYGSPDINITNISDALSSFVSSIFSANSRFDRSLNQMAQLTALEQEGKNLFMTKYNCNSCHQTQALNGYELGGKFSNIGLESDYTDKGLQTITGAQGDIGKFKIPALRNVALTAPYMHDGRFKTLNQVLDHYSSAIVDHPALDPRLRENNGRPLVMNISDHEKTAIIAFLNSMTDYTMITDPKFSNPFRVR